MKLSNIVKGFLLGILIVLGTFFFINNNERENYKENDIDLTVDKSMGNTEIVNSIEEVESYLAKTYAITTIVEEENKKGKSREITITEWQKNLNFLIAEYNKLDFPNEIIF